MRELIFKNLNTPISKKRDISLEEIVERNGLISSTKKRSIYFIRGACQIKSKKALQKWLNERKKDPRINKKFFHILREYSEQKKEDKLICKMRGSFYIVSGDSAYNIVFVHTIKIEIHKS